MRKINIFFALFIFVNISVNSQAQLVTVAEKSDYKSTADNKEVMSLIEQLTISSPYIRIENIAKSVEGNDVPLLIIGKPLPKSPDDLINDKRIVVYVQANIHAGEVEGKEATLMYARDLLKEKDPELLKNVVLLICPLFNPDGNEKISPANRTYQNGPVNGVGVRHNGQLLDLNRDGMKAESPEVRGVITNVFNRWDPSVLNQGHYTNMIRGRFVQDTIDFPAGTIIVRSAQPLANIAAYLLEPQSNEGMVTWNFFDRYLVPQWGMGYNTYPVYRVMTRIDFKTIPVW